VLTLNEEYGARAAKSAELGLRMKRSVQNVHRVAYLV